MPGGSVVDMRFGVSDRDVMALEDSVSVGVANSCFCDCCDDMSLGLIKTLWQTEELRLLEDITGDTASEGICEQFVDSEGVSLAALACTDCRTRTLLNLDVEGMSGATLTQAVAPSVGVDEDLAAAEF